MCLLKQLSLWRRRGKNTEGFFFLNSYYYCDNAANVSWKVGTETEYEGRLAMLINCQFDAMSRAESPVLEQKPAS